MKFGIYPLKKIFFFLCIGVVLMSSCSYKGRNALLKDSLKLNKDSLKTVFVSNPTEYYDEYKIKPFDLIALRNLQNPALIGGESQIVAGNPKDANFRVEKDGTLNLPVIGSIKVEGLTKSEAKNLIEGEYKKSLFVDPIIELNIISLKVTILGESKAPGNYLLEQEDNDIIDLIGQSGGVTDEANTKRVRILRGERSNPEIIYVNLSNVNSLTSPKLKLLNGDVIIIDKQRFYNSFDKFRDATTLFTIITSILNTYIIITKLSN